MKFKRLLRHLLTPPSLARRRFPRATLKAIERAVGQAEQHHRGELRFVVEGPLPLKALLADQTARQRAGELFGRLGVWDTEENSGILVYVQLVDRQVEIVADRGIAGRVAQEEWDAICRGMEAAFRKQKWEQGALQAINAAGLLLAAHFPARDDNPDELPDAPMVL